MAERGRQCCFVCRTHLHIGDADLPDGKLPATPGHDHDGCAGRHSVSGPHFRSLSLLCGGTRKPLRRAGLIGWRSLKMAGEGRRIGLYGLGASAHLLAQVLRWQEREVYAFIRGDDADAQAHALRRGACWAGDSG